MPGSMRPDSIQPPRLDSTPSPEPIPPPEAPPPSASIPPPGASRPRPDAEAAVPDLGAWAVRSPTSAVVGLQWGDEGKGKIVDWLAAHHDVVVRFNGGANAGHSVVIDGVRHALHLVPCGVLQPSTQNVIGNGVVVDLAGVRAELAALETAGIRTAGRVWISERAHVVMPWHPVEDRMLEAAVARLAGESAAVGTTGRGIGPCYADKALRTTAFRVADLFESDRTERVRRVCALKNATLRALAGLAEQPFEPFDAVRIDAELAEVSEAVRSMVTDTSSLLRAAVDAGDRILFEGANACLLDVDHGTYPYVTSSQTTALGIGSGAGIAGGAVEVIGVAKAYQTRVGAGPMPTEQDNAIGQRLRERGREYGTTTGRPRRCGWLDLAALRHTARLTGATRIAVMLLDVLSGFEALKVAVGYRLDGRTIDHPPARAEDFARCEPIYESLPVFETPIDGARTFADLPPAAASYVRRIESFVGVPVSIVSVGPDRSQTLLR